MSEKRLSIDPRLQAGAVLRVAPPPRGRMEGGHGHFSNQPVFDCADVDAVIDRLTCRPGRPHLAVVLVWLREDWRSTLAALMPWMDFAYPRTPIIGISSGWGRDLAECCRDHQVLSSASCDIAAVARAWDEEVLSARRFILGCAGPNSSNVQEHLLRMVDALLQCVPEKDLAAVRGISEASAVKYRQQIRDIFEVASLEYLRVRWERARLGRGAVTRGGRGEARTFPDAAGFR